MYKTIGALLLGIIVSAGAYLFTQNEPAVDAVVVTSAGFGDGHTVTMYKDPNCGCCTGHALALIEEGFDVIIEETSDMESVKAEHNIPLFGESCHTSIIDGYVVEGHVPLEAIKQLREEQPDIAGIGLPSMPIGTPGMPGPKTAPYEVYQLSEGGDMTPYLTI